MRRFPLYIPSKGRSEYMMTSLALTRMGVQHYVVVEPQQMDEYRNSIKRMGLLASALELDLSYKSAYETCDDLGLTRSTGPGPARNFAWDHSVATGHDWHWVMDDNIRSFLRMNNNKRIQCESPKFWAAMEDFVLRYSNVAMAGPNYSMFAVGSARLPPFITNTRIYSCNFIRNDVPYRWRGRYNEDTILSLDLLKAGWCTIQFNAFLQAKINTQTMKGGNTTEFYHAEGRKPGVFNKQHYFIGGTVEKSKMLVRVHPDNAELKWKFGRVHHYVNYRVFSKQKLVRRPEYRDIKGIPPNEYGMALMIEANSAGSNV